MKSTLELNGNMIKRFHQEGMNLLEELIVLKKLLLLHILYIFNEDVTYMEDVRKRFFTNVLGEAVGKYFS